MWNAGTAPAGQDRHSGAGRRHGRHGLAAGVLLPGRRSRSTRPSAGSGVPTSSPTRCGRPEAGTAAQRPEAGLRLRPRSARTASAPAMAARAASSPSRNSSSVRAKSKTGPQSNSLVQLDPYDLGAGRELRLLAVAHGRGQRGDQHVERVAQDPVCRRRTGHVEHPDPVAGLGDVEGAGERDVLGDAGVDVGARAVRARAGRRAGRSRAARRTRRSGRGGSRSRGGPARPVAMSVVAIRTGSGQVLQPVGRYPLPTTSRRSRSDGEQVGPAAGDVEQRRRGGCRTGTPRSCRARPRPAPRCPAGRGGSRRSVALMAPTEPPIRRSGVMPGARAAPAASRPVRRRGCRRRRGRRCCVGLSRPGDTRAVAVA